MSNVHSEQTVSDGIHIAVRGTHANSAARLADSYTAADEGGIYRQLDDDSFYFLQDATGPTFVQVGAGSGDASGPASSTDNAIARFDGAGGKTLQNSGVIVDDSNNVSGVANLVQTGYIEVADISAPANPGAGKGRVYKKTGNDGLFYLPDAAGPEVDLTASGGAVKRRSHQFSFWGNIQSTNWIGIPLSENIEADKWDADYSTGPTGYATGRGVYIPRASTLISIDLHYYVNGSSSNNAATAGCWRMRKTTGSTSAPTLTNIFNTSLSPHVANAPYNKSFTLSTTDLDAGDLLFFAVKGANASFNYDIFGHWHVEWDED